MKLTMSGINTILLTLLLGVASFIGVKVWDLNTSISQAASVMTLHTTQISGIQTDVKIAASNSEKSLWASEWNGKQITALQTKVDSIRR